jgi:Ankyrin repeats (3 copies)
MALLGKAKKGSIDAPDPLGVGVSLAHLIERREWSSVVARIRQDPMEADQELQVMTRGGFMASTGMSPLHFACERKPPSEVVRLLMEAFPVAILTRAMPGGCLPLHIACTWGGSADVVKILLAADPGSARIKDELGNIALHSACFSGADLHVTEALVQCDAKTVLARNHQGSRPLDICKRLRHENRRTVMALLSKKRDDIVRSHNRDGSSGLLSDIAREAEALNQRYVVVWCKQPCAVV